MRGCPRWLRSGSNQLRTDFQSVALPFELLSHEWVLTESNRIGWLFRPVQSPDLLKTRNEGQRDRASNSFHRVPALYVAANTLVGLPFSGRQSTRNSIPFYRIHSLSKRRQHLAWFIFQSGAPSGSRTRISFLPRTRFDHLS